MCRSIKVLRKRGTPPATSEEVHAAALQFVRKISGYRTPPKVHEGAFAGAVDGIAGLAADLLRSIESSPGRATSRDRDTLQPQSPKRAESRGQ